MTCGVGFGLGVPVGKPGVLVFECQVLGEGLGPTREAAVSGEGLGKVPRRQRLDAGEMG